MLASPMDETTDWVFVCSQVTALVDDDDGAEGSERAKHTDRNEFSFPSLQRVTRKHWKADDQRSSCANDQCRKKFTLTQRRRHCRRCGDIFCSDCVGYKRKLNRSAEPDPINGEMQSVCFPCYDEGPQSMGTGRSWRNHFFHLRQERKMRRQSNKQNPKYKSSSRATSLLIRKRLAVGDELDRLLKGFKANAGSWVKSAVSELVSPLIVPEWQKSVYWEEKSMVANCTNCQDEFGILKKKHHCRVCGCIFCAKCSSSDLLLFMPEAKVSQPMWALNGKEGCPEKKPSAYLLLVVCVQCSAVLEKMKCDELYPPSEEDENSMSNIMLLHSRLLRSQKRIEEVFPTYQDIVDELRIGDTGPTAMPSDPHFVKTLAKCQGDISDNMTKFALCLQKVKTIKPTTQTQQLLLGRLAKGKVDFYQGKMCRFRALKALLRSHLPPEMLEMVQTDMDLMGIRMTYFTIKQMGFEVLHLVTKHKLDEYIASLWIEPVEKCGREFQSLVEGKGESWEDETENIEELLREGIKSHRLIRPSTQLTQQYGSDHVLPFLLQRVDYLLLQTTRQLEAKSSAKSFRGTKRSLRDLQKDVLSFADELVAGSGRDKARPTVTS